MASWKPVDIDYDEIGEEDDKWDDDVVKDLESRFEILRQGIRKLSESRDKATREEALIFVDVTRHDVEVLVANQIYDKLTILFNNTRKKLGIQNVKPYRSFKKH